MNCGGYMAPADDPNPLLYTPCSHHYLGRNDEEIKCLNEGWLFCTLCHGYFCEEHACIHLAYQVNSDAVREVSSETPTSNTNQSTANDSFTRSDPTEDSNLDRESRAFFRELSPEQLTNTGEIALRSYFRRLLSEAKRIQREIERRMIYATEMSGGPAYRRKRHLSQDEIDAARDKTKRKLDLTPLGLIEREARELRAKELQKRKQQEIQANIAILAEQIKLGNLNIDALKKLGAKK